MFRKYVALALAVLVINLACGVTPFAASQDEKAAKFAEKVKTKIAKLGSGVDAKIQVRLKDGTKIKGYVSEIKADSFTVMNEKTGTTNEVLYSQVKQANGNNSATGYILGIALAIGLFVILAKVALRNS